MKIHLYTLCWNEADMLGFFFRHYDSLVDRYVIYDDGSTDSSLDILRAHPKVELRRFRRTHAASFVLSHQQLQNEVWKESRGEADWVIITAIDEHLQVYGQENADYLVACSQQGVTLVPAIGYQIVSEEFPAREERLVSTRRMGAPFGNMNKLSVFNPDAIINTGFTVGRHGARPYGRLILPKRDEMMLLHYKYLGFERTLQRHIEQQSGLGTTDLKEKWGCQYLWPSEKLREDWNGFLNRVLEVGGAGSEPWLSGNHEPELWWRTPGFENYKPSLLRRLGLRSR